MALTVLTRDRLTTVVIEIVLPVGKLPLMICSKQAVSCHVCFNSTPGNRRCTLGIGPYLFDFLIHEYSSQKKWVGRSFITMNLIKSSQIN